MFYILVRFGVVFGTFSLFLGPRLAAVTIVWLVASFIVGGQLHIEMSWASFLPVMAMTAIPFVVFEVARYAIIHRQELKQHFEDDAILREARRRAEDDAIL